MFYWSFKGIHLILTDEEEMALVRKLSANNGVDIIGYDLWPETRNKYEKKISKHLKRAFLSDSEEFRKKYVFRSCYGNEAKDIFPLMLDAYGRITKLATIGKYGGSPLKDDAVEDLILSGEGEIYHVTIFKYLWFPIKIVRPLCKISIPASSIEKLTGSVDSFVLMTSNLHIRFGRKFIRISVCSG